MSDFGLNITNEETRTIDHDLFPTTDQDGFSPISTLFPRFSTITSVLANTSQVAVGRTNQSAQGNLLEGLIVPLYGTIFLLSVIGNSLVLITLARNKRMRTVTNVYLLNLAVSDLLLGVFCMPFTLIGQILKNFVFGETMCKLIPYFQAVSVSVGVWTLVAISLERYFAICRPLKSRRWQTQFHAYKMIAIVWLASVTWNLPIFFVSRLKATSGGRHKCREEWPSVSIERAYNLFLDGTLLLIPLIVMSLAYSLIAMKLWRGLKREIRQTSTCQRRLERSGSGFPGTARNSLSTYSGNERVASNATTVVLRDCKTSTRSKRGFQESSGCLNGDSMRKPSSTPRVSRMRITKMLAGQKCSSSTDSDTSQRQSSTSSRIQGRTNGNGCQVNSRETINTSIDTQDSICPLGRQHAIRSNYMGKSIEAKKKVIRMLFVIVLEFFVCWAPLHVINTWYLFAPQSVYSMVGTTGISLVQLLAYISSCCNPITYCFMNRKFRQAFLGLFDCHRCWRVSCGNVDAPLGVARNTVQGGNNSEVSGNDSTIYLGRTSLVGRSEIIRLLEEEDRV